MSSGPIPAYNRLTRFLSQCAVLITGHVLTVNALAEPAGLSAVLKWAETLSYVYALPLLLVVQLIGQLSKTVQAPETGVLDRDQLEELAEIVDRRIWALWGVVALTVVAAIETRFASAYDGESHLLRYYSSYLAVQLALSMLVMMVWVALGFVEHHRFTIRVRSQKELENIREATIARLQKGGDDPFPPSNTPVIDRPRRRRKPRG